MVAVSIGLLIIGEDRHKYFAIWSANTFRNKFRWIGMLTIPFAIFLIYIALGQSILHFT